MQKDPAFLLLFYRGDAFSRASTASGGRASPAARRPPPRAYRRRIRGSRMYFMAMEKSGQRVSFAVIGYGAITHEIGRTLDQRG